MLNTITIGLKDAKTKKCNFGNNRGFLVKTKKGFGIF